MEEASVGETDIARNEAPCNGEEIVATMTECGDGDATTPTEVLKSLVADGSILTSIEDGDVPVKSFQCQLEDALEREKKLMEEKDELQMAYNKCNLAQSKLQSLCRELQRHCKAIKEECQQRNKEEEDRRQEVALKFQASVSDITVKLNEHHKRNQILKAENVDLVSRLKNMVEQFERHEEHCDKLFKQKQLEVQLCEAKLAQQAMFAAEEKERSLAEKQMLLSETAEKQRKCEALTQQEVELRSQLSLYTEKFEEFQKTLTKSNEVFATFKKEMDKMTKTIGKLEKETTMWRTRWENSNRSLLEMVEERTIREKTLLGLQTKSERLERLCRALQSERTEFARQLKASQSAAESSAGDVKGSEEKRDGGDKSPTLGLPLSNTAFHSIDDIPPPALLNADDSSDASDKSSSHLEASSGSHTAPTAKSGAGSLDARGSDGDGSASHESGSEASSVVGGNCLASLSDSFATASDMLKQANRISHTLPPLDKGQMSPQAAVEQPGLPNSECSSPEAPDNFELPWSGDTVSG